MQKNNCLNEYRNRLEFITLYDKYGDRLRRKVLLQLFHNCTSSIIRRYILLHERYKRYSKKRFVILYGKVNGTKKYLADYINRRQKSSRCIEYWMSRGYSLDIAKEKIKNLQNITSLKSFINRYGEEQGKQKYDQYVQHSKQSRSLHTKEFKSQIRDKIKKKWKNKTISEREKIKQKTSNTLYNFKRRYGNAIGEQKYNQYISNLKRTSKRCIEYWLKLGYNIEDARNKVSEHQVTFSLKKCIEKYGNRLGTQRWKKRQIKWRKAFNKNDQTIINLKRKANSHSGYYSECYFNNYPDLKNVAGYIYVMQFVNPISCIKVGITRRNPAKRFYRRGIDYNILLVKKMPLYEAFLLEQKICLMYNDSKVNCSEISVRETFWLNTKDEIMRIIKEN